MRKVPFFPLLLLLMMTYGLPVLAQPVLTINDPRGPLCIGTTFNFTVGVSGSIPPGYIYQWTLNGAPAGMVNSPNYTLITPAAGDLVVCDMIPSSGPGTAYPSNTVTIELSGLNQPTVSITGGGPACEGDPVTFDATANKPIGEPVYQWLVNGVFTGSNSPVFTSSSLSDGDRISCAFTNNAICVTQAPWLSNIITLMETPSVVPGISIAATNLAVCSGSPANFTATVQNGGSGPTYQWQVNGQPAGTNDPTFSVSTLADGDIVSCVLLSDALCATPPTASSNSIPISVIPSNPSSIKVFFTPPQACPGQQVDFSASGADPGTEPVYTWQVNGNTVGTNSPRFSSSSISNGDVVSCSLDDATGCVIPSVGSVTPVINPAPSVGTAPVILLNKGQSVTLDLPVTGSVATYNWSPATGLSDPAIADPLATPLKNTTYTLQATSPDGCSDTGSVIVQVFSQLAIASAFSPNGDGRNDIFYVLGGPIGSQVEEFSVFDRWGQRVFQAHDTPPGDPGFGWDGRANGHPAPTGAYVYEIVVKFAGGERQMYKGTVMLVR